MRLIPKGSVLERVKEREPANPGSTVKQPKNGDEGDGCGYVAVCVCVFICMCLYVSVQVLQSFKIMDYSLLLGVHKVNSDSATASRQTSTMVRSPTFS